MSSEVKITVVIPTYNRADFLSKTIESVLNQTTKPDEVIVVDDGSTDNTKQILKNYDIKYIYQANQGVSVARNTGIQYATNDWICFLDSDDIWEQSKLTKQIDFHKNNSDILISYTDELWIYNNKIIKQTSKQQKEANPTFLNSIDLCKIGASTVMVHKTIFDNIGLFDSKLTACEDYDMWLRILRKYKIGYLDEKLVQKIAGHHGQLSFETIGIDYYRIKALQKHINSQYKNQVQHQINLKKKILLKGAIKHNNQFFIDFCQQ